jgi:alpha-L-fucosidase
MSKKAQKRGVILFTVTCGLLLLLLSSTGFCQELPSIKYWAWVDGGFLWAAAIVEKPGSAFSASTQDRASWMKEARWGVMTHYLADWIARSANETMSAEKWNNLVDNFDVEGLAEQIKSVGAGYHILTIGQNSGYYLAPNATYDRLVGIQPSKCSRRDLVADMYEALHKRGIKLIVYLPAGAPGGDPVARKALEWQAGAHRNREFQIKWEQVIREWSLRWSNKIAGWWFDGCYWPNAMYRSAEPPNFASFAAAARAGNPDSVVAFNPGVVDRILSVTPYEDYSAGEIDQPDRMMIRRAVNGIVDGVQVHVLSYLGARWGMGLPRFSEEQVVTWSRKIASSGGVITWDVPVQRNGLISQPFIDQLTAVGKALRENRR